MFGVVLLASLASSAPASAQWGSGANKTSQPMAMASIGHTFTPVAVGSLLGVSSGTGGSTYSSNWAGLGATFYFDLRNDSSLAMDHAGQVRATLSSGLALLPSVDVYSCSVAWNRVLGTCPGTRKRLAGPYPMNTAPTFNWGTLQPGETQHIAVTTGVALANVRLDASAQPVLRPGTDRSNG
jgi:hypothetical protein